MFIWLPNYWAKYFWIWNFSGWDIRDKGWEILILVFLMEEKGHGVLTNSEKF